jgi:hypothetical protein
MLKKLNHEQRLILLDCLEKLNQAAGIAPRPHTSAMTSIARKHLEADLAARTAELAACEDGSWPRNTNDALRWQNLPRMPYDPHAVVRKAHQEYVASLCRQEIEWLSEQLERKL